MSDTVFQRYGLTLRAALIGAICLLISLQVVPAEDVADTWDLTPMFASDEAWQSSLDEFKTNMSALDPYKGRLGSSAETLGKALELFYGMQLRADRLGVYASMRGDGDLRESGPQGMRQAFRTVMADFGAATAWIDPELLAIGRERIAAFLSERPTLAVYRRDLDRLEKLRAHTLDKDAEELLGMAQRIRGVGNTVGGLLRNAEMPWPTITLSDGEELTLNSSGYAVGRAKSNREDRIAVYEAFYGELQDFKGSLAATLSATVQEHIFEARVRGFDSSLDAALLRNEVDPAVYRMLVDEINVSLPTLYRYFKLRAKILGIDDLRYHDLYPPLVQDVATDYSWSNSKAIVAQALTPLGDEYVERLTYAVDNRWVDVYPGTGKRSGAYVNGVYDVHPYMLLNHQDDYSSLTTFAHEAGHLIHSWYSDEAQPYPTSQYVIFVAEVASTVNEVILFKNLVASAADDDARLAILGNFLEGLRGTVFRQTMFAEFELAIHEMAERGEPLTGDALNALYLDNLRRYHGEAQGVMRIDEAYAAEWAYVPHFHYNFYVYQYATSYISAIALAEGIIENRPGARERYLDFLKAGSTKPPVELLQQAGVDMTSPEPIRAAVRLMTDVLEQMEEIVARR